MALTAPVIAVLAFQSQAAQLSAVPATGGVGPYTYQWYMSTTPGFTPGGSNDIEGATELNLNTADFPAVVMFPNNTYYFKLVATDTGNSNATVTSNQEVVVTETTSQGQNQFDQTPQVGQPDLQMSPNTTAAQIDSSETGRLGPGQAVKIVGTAGGGIPKVVACTADTDKVWGYINLNAKKTNYYAGDVVEVSQKLNAIYLVSSTAINRGDNVCLITASKSVAAATGSSGKRIVGYAFDLFPAAGSIGRVILETPTGGLDS